MEIAGFLSKRGSTNEHIFIMGERVLRMGGWLNKPLKKNGSEDGTKESPADWLFFLFSIFRNVKSKKCRRSQYGLWVLLVLP